MLTMYLCPELILILKTSKRMKPIKDLLNKLNLVLSNNNHRVKVIYTTSSNKLIIMVIIIPAITIVVISIINLRAI